MTAIANKKLQPKQLAVNDFKFVQPKLINDFIGAPNLTKGRYSYLFNQVRQDAYKDIKFYIKNYTGFLQAITERCTKANATLYEPCDLEEIAGLPQYIADWVFARKNTFAASEIGRRKSLKVRQVNAINKQITARNMASLGWGVQQIADTLGLGRTTVWKYLKIIKS